VFAIVSGYLVNAKLWVKSGGEREEKRKKSLGERDIFSNLGQLSNCAKRVWKLTSTPVQSHMIHSITTSTI